MSVESSFNRGYNFIVLANSATSFTGYLGLVSFNYPILTVYVHQTASGTPSGYVLATVTPGDEVNAYFNPQLWFMVDLYTGARHIPLAPYEYVKVSISVSYGSANIGFDAYLYDWLGEAPWTT